MKQVFLMACVLGLNVFAQDIELGNVVAVERKIEVKLSDCEKTWNKVLKECTVITSEKGIATDYTLPGQQWFKRFEIKGEKAGVSMYYSTLPNGSQGYTLRYVSSHLNNSLFSEARPWLELALAETGGTVSARLFIVK